MIHLSQIRKQQGSRVLFKDGNMQILPGDKIGLVGPNGAGKTTIFRIIVGEEGVDQGTVNIAKDTVIGYFSQSIGDMKGRSALEQVKSAAGVVSELGEKIAAFEKIFESMAEKPLSDRELETVMAEYGEAQAEYQARGGYDLDARAKAVLTGLGIGPNDYDRPVEYFSGGWKMRIALAGILVLNPDVLLMDEPTNYLDLESIIWLEEWIKSFEGALVMTSHDREFMNRCIKRVVEIANGSVTGYQGNYEYYLKEREIRREQLLASHRRQQEMISKEEDFIARFAARASHAAQVQSRVKKLDKIDRIEIPAEQKVIDFTFEVPPRSGNEVLKMDALGKRWELPEGGYKEVFSGASAVVQRLNKIAVTGVNGAGKSTLLKVVMGLTQPTSGQVSLGASLRTGYFSQHALDVLDGRATVLEEVTHKLPDLSTGNIRSLLGAFLFSGDDVDKKVSQLSGGEKSRVVLAILLASKANFLVLDEPTNHLDIDSREVLLNALKTFEGTLMIVSHDRFFLREVANRVFEVDHGKINIYEGGYDYYRSKQPQAGTIR